jgi:hypothetical protein
MSDNIEYFRPTNMRSGGRSTSKGQSYNTRRRPGRYSGTHTLGRTGGVPFWGWNYYPWMRVSYPFYDYAEYPEFIEYATVEEVKETKTKESKTKESK